MKILKLALLLTGVLMACQALAHKVSRPMSTPATVTHLAPAQTDTNPVALLDGIRGRSALGIPAMPALPSVAAPAKTSDSSTRINRRH
jgi:hypothetical protein